MITKKLSTILTGCYLLLAVSTVAYELSIRLFDRGHSEFAGMLSVALSLPASVAVIWIGKAAFGVNVGHSDVSFVVILGLSALANACIVWLVFVMLSRQR
ncbi:MAG: hypothetical protein EXR70_14280 [Deltaproteobacteria bacterium]|nr:hypothetical protein [Deltaproteobacteria bacterium]